ncbi:unnamed protein product, partial [Ixodes hexagonus]
MDAPLLACTREEQRSVIRFLGAEGEKPADIHRRMLKQYGYGCISLRQVYEWHKKFQSGASSLTDAPRSGRAHTSTTPDAISVVERLIHRNWRVTIDEVAEELNISHGSTHHIIPDILQYDKVSARWVPKQLT